MNMRRKPTTQGGTGSYNNQRNKPRYQQGSGGAGGHQGGHHNNRPRKNYPQAREKYLAQARDALASGDRVLAENYFQHADHCYRMMMEEAASRPQPRAPQPQQTDEQGEPQNNDNAEHNVPDNISANNSALPAFLTGNYEGGEQPPEPVIVQNWEE